MSTNEADIKNAFGEFWQTVMTVFTTSLTPEEWDIVICCVWDEGRVAAEPAKCLLPFRFPQTESDLDQNVEHFKIPHMNQFVSIYVAEHEKQYIAVDRLLPDEGADTDAFDTEFAHLTDQKIQLMRETADSSTIREQLESLGISKSIFAAIASETYHEVNLIHIFGPDLPSPQPPQTSLEVFSRLLHHADHYVSKHCGLEFEDGALVSVKLDGGDTTDATIELLTDVENLQSLCRDLRTISILESKVSERGEHKLRTLLPHVNVIR
ncbi:hypothetical protein [Symmachiella macrocystis]|nr:hypothetical protein [Symmachiella macrocystis]